MEFRIEKDTMGEVKVPANRYWGAQTERSRNNFKIGPAASMPHEIIEAFAYLKKAAAFANADLGVLPAEKRDLIAAAFNDATRKVEAAAQQHISQFTQGLSLPPGMDNFFK